MTAAEDILERRARCVPHLARLRLLAAAAVGEPFPPAIADDISKEVALILAEAFAAALAVISAAGSRQHAVTVFLNVRLARLVSAAGQVTDAVKADDAALLHRSFSRFEALISAMWTVELASASQATVTAGR